MKMMRVIINADDLGMSMEVNASIEKAIKEGCISSSTIMANAPAFEDAVRIAKNNPQISYGVHLNVDEFAPLTNNDVFRKYQIVDETGVFKKEILHKFPVIEDELVGAIYTEWKAQVDKVFASGIVPTHLDSHEHTHGIICLQEILIRLLKEYNIQLIRRKPYTSIAEMIINRGVKINQPSNKKNSLQPQVSHITKSHSFFIRRLLQLKDGCIQRKWIRRMHKEGIVTTAFFDSYQMFCNAYPKLLKYRRVKTVELMTHPGHPGYQIETDLVMQKKLNSVCKYELINYNHIKK